MPHSFVMTARCFMSLQPSSLADNLNTSKKALGQTFCFQGDVLQITADVYQTERKPPTANPNQVKINSFGLFSSAFLSLRAHTSEGSAFHEVGTDPSLFNTQRGFGNEIRFQAKALRSYLADIWSQFPSPLVS